MATDQRNLPAFFATDQNFRDWGAGIAAQLVACGLVKTADTGQIDLATALKPATINTAVGYEVYRFNDALQATLPVFVKIEYGSGAAATTPGLWITVGTASSGAGAITGQVGTRKQLTGSAAKATGVVTPSYCSGSQVGAPGGRIWLLTNIDPANANYASFFCIERPKQSDGTPTADGIATLAAASGAGASALVQHIPAAGTVPAGASTITAVNPLHTSGQSIVGVNVALSPVFVFLGKALFMWPLVYSSVDIGQLAPIQVNHLGALRTFMPFGSALFPLPASFLGGTLGMALRWE